MSNDALETRIAQKILRMDRMSVDTGSGFRPFLVKLKAGSCGEDGNTIILGRTEDGSQRLFCGRLCPAWSTDLNAIWRLINETLQILPNIPPEALNFMLLLTGANNLTTKSPEVVAHTLCVALLDVLEIVKLPEQYFVLYEQITEGDKTTVACGTDREYVTALMDKHAQECLLDGWNTCLYYPENYWILQRPQKGFCSIWVESHTGTC